MFSISSVSSIIIYVINLALPIQSILCIYFLYIFQRTQLTYNEYYMCSIVHVRESISNQKRRKAKKKSLSAIAVPKASQHVRSTAAFSRRYSLYTWIAELENMCVGVKKI